MLWQLVYVQVEFHCFIFCYLIGGSIEFLLYICIFKLLIYIYIFIGAPPPPYNTSYQPGAPPQYPPNPEQSTYPPTAPPSYSSTQDQPKAYPVQTGGAPYPQQGVPPAYGHPAYPTQGAATGYTTQAVGVAYHPHAQTTIITQVLFYTTSPGASTF